MDKEFLRAGQLDTPIDVYYNTNTQNSFGEITKSTTLLKTIWAKLLPKGGKEGVEDSVIVATNKVNFLVRWDTALEMNSTTKSPEEYFVIKYLNKFWNISDMSYNGRGKGIVIKCYYTDNN